MKRKFLTKTAITQHQSIAFFRDPFKLVPTSKLAELADKFTRNEIMSSNEFRQVVGLLPSDDPRANELRNKNINQSNGQQFPSVSDSELEEQTDSQSDRSSEKPQLDQGTVNTVEDKSLSELKVSEI